MTDPVQYLVAVLLLLAVPGPTNAVMAVAGGSGRRPAWLFVAAMLAGYGTIIAVARFVLLPLTAATPALGIAIKLVVVAYLLYAAMRLWRSRSDASGVTREVGPGLVFATTALNPKGLVFAFSVIPVSHPLLLAYLADFAVLTVAVGAAWFAAGRLVAVRAGPRAALIPRAGALVLAGFAAWIAATIAA